MDHVAEKLFKNLENRAFECLTYASGGSKSGYITAIADLDTGIVECHYGLDGPYEVPHLNPSEQHAWAQIPANFSDRDMIASAITLLLRDALVEDAGVESLRPKDEQELRAEMRKVRELAVKACNKGLQTEEDWFDDRLVAVKQKITMLAERRQEKNMERDMSRRC